MNTQFHLVIVHWQCTWSTSDRTGCGLEVSRNDALGPGGVLVSKVQRWEGLSRQILSTRWDGDVEMVNKCTMQTVSQCLSFVVLYILFWWWLASCFTANRKEHRHESDEKTHLGPRKSRLDIQDDIEVQRKNSKSNQKRNVKKRLASWQISVFFLPDRPQRVIIGRQVWTAK
jgi:hypothetical protein